MYRFLYNELVEYSDLIEYQLTFSLLSLQNELIKPCLFSVEIFLFLWSVPGTCCPASAEGRASHSSAALGGGGLAMLSLRTGLTVLEGPITFPHAAGLVRCHVGTQKLSKGRVNCWNMSFLNEENLSEGDELMEWSLRWKFC